MVVQEVFEVGLGLCGLVQEPDNWRKVAVPDPRDVGLEASEPPPDGRRRKRACPDV